jgi:hypothetical protein
LRKLRIPAIIILVAFFIALPVALFTIPLPRCDKELNCANTCAS